MSYPCGAQVGVESDTGVSIDPGVLAGLVVCLTVHFASSHSSLHHLQEEEHVTDAAERFMITAPALTEASRDSRASANVHVLLFLISLQLHV